MIKDPLIAWNGPYPYDALAPVGASPEMSHADMQDVSFDLLTKGLMKPHTQRAWDELRTIQRRLVVDFLLYDVDYAAARARVRRELEKPGEPPEVAQALTLTPPPPGRLAAELGEILLEEPEQVPPMPEFGTVAPADLAGRLIRFDR